MFTPVESAFGAFLLHLSTTSLLVGTGRVFGASGVLERAMFGPEARDNVSLVAGVGLSALGTWYLDAWWMPEYGGAPAVFGSFSWVLCGLLVGAGTKLSNGCTSGHMLCGIPLRSTRSAVSSVVFSTSCLLTATVVGLNTRPTAACGTAEKPCYTAVYPSRGRVLSMLALTIPSTLITWSAPPVPRALVRVWSGALFGLGLMVSGMADPTKPLGFFSVIPDRGRRWDPSFLMIPFFAMAPNYLVWGRYASPAIAAAARRGGVTWQVVAGAALFGFGWGLLGVCPGPGIIGGFLGGWNGFSWVMGFLAGRRAF